MFFTTSFITLAVSLATMASASPVARQTCSPNFEGTAVSVLNGGREWGVSGADVIARTANLQTADFRFEQRGQPATSYTIKDVTTPSNGNGLVLAAPSDAGLHLEAVDVTGADIAQDWSVVCGSCSTGISPVQGSSVLVSFGCSIVSTATGLCVQMGMDSDGDDPVFMALCNGQESQNFDFWTAPA